MYYKLSDYAKKFNVTYRTAWNRYKKGLIPSAFVDETGHVMIPVPKLDNQVDKRAIIYARVSNNDAKNNLNRQLIRLREYAVSNGYTIVSEVKEIGSGLNDNRKKLSKALNKNGWNTLIVENKDRLTRFGFNYISLLLKQQNKNIVVVNQVEGSEKKDLVEDLVSIIYSFSARIYGLKKAKNKQKEILETINK